jgi:hypothetical protein
MIVKASTQLHVPCPNWECSKLSRADQLTIGQSTIWTCDDCHLQFRIKRVSDNDFETDLTGVAETPVTVTLRSATVPPITLKLNTWKYAHSQGLPPEEYESNERYFYNEHTCPTNWVHEIEEIEFQGDTDPHGVFEFVSVEDGHYIDPNDVSYDTEMERQAKTKPTIN